MNATKAPVCVLILSPSSPLHYLSTPPPPPLPFHSPFSPLSGVYFLLVLLVLVWRFCVVLGMELESSICKADALTLVISLTPKIQSFISVWCVWVLELYVSMMLEPFFFWQSSWTFGEVVKIIGWQSKRNYGEGVLLFFIFPLLLWSFSEYAEMFSESVIQYI